VCVVLPYAHRWVATPLSAAGSIGSYAEVKCDRSMWAGVAVAPGHPLITLPLSLHKSCTPCTPHTQVTFVMHTLCW
jgi:hypothetical protein